MKLDSIITSIVIKIANKREVSSDKVLRIMKSYHKGIKHVISDVDKATVVKLDFLGKIVYDEKAFLASERLKEKVKNDNWIPELKTNEVTNNQPGNQAT